MRRKTKKIGGSVGVIVPRDVAEIMGIKDGSDVNLSLVGKTLVVEPSTDDMPDASFRRAFATVLRKRASSFKRLADFDAGRA